MTQLERLKELREDMDRAFAADTAVPGGWNAEIPSSGHCAIVAIVVQGIHGGEFVSATVNGVSHWFNRFDGFDVDLTGDQFGRPHMQAASAGELYAGTRVREPRELNEETKRRAAIFVERLT